MARPADRRAAGAGDAAHRGPCAGNLILDAHQPPRIFEDLRVADLFAGSGALGLEALSRGAGSATFVEKDAKAAAAIRRNAEKLGAATALASSAARRWHCPAPIRST